jgi:ABC-type amino acid transport substrate-binding protein
MRVPQLVVSDQKSGGAVELEKLDSQTRVAVRMPSVTADYLRSTYPHLNLQGVPLERQALQLLLSQQASYAVVDEAQLGRSVCRAGVRRAGGGRRHIGLPQLLRIATRRDWPELAGIVESALRAIPAKDLETLHNQWLQPKYPRLSESPGFWQNLSLLLRCCCSAWPSWSGSAASSTAWSNDCWRRSKTSPCARPAKKPCG